jgi:hypothetical protein
LIRVRMQRGRKPSVLTGGSIQEKLARLTRAHCTGAVLQ